MRILKLLLIITLIILFIPIIEVEKIYESNGSTVLDYRNLVSYGWEYTIEWYLNYKENLDNGEQESSIVGNEIEGKDDKSNQVSRVDER